MLLNDSIILYYIPKVRLHVWLGDMLVDLNINVKEFLVKTGRYSESLVS